MTDFANFRRLAETSFPTLNVGTCIHAHNNAQSSSTELYRLRLSGPGIGGKVLTVERETATAAVAEAARAVGKARRDAAEQAAPPVAEPEANAAVVYATPRQKEEIIRLLNHPKITRPEKTKGLLGINRYTEARADELLERLKQAIADREAA